MEFPCKAAICLFNLFIVSTTGYTKNLVVIRNNLLPHYFHFFFNIPGIMGKEIIIIARTHLYSLFFNIIVGINNIVVGLFSLIR
jgi:hypothetical protein